MNRWSIDNAFFVVVHLKRKCRVQRDDEKPLYPKWFVIERIEAVEVTVD